MSLNVVDQISEIFWAMVPGFNVYASTRKQERKTGNDSSASWKVLFHGTDGPYVLNTITWTSSLTPYTAYGGDVRCTVDGNVLQFRVQHPDPYGWDEQDNWLPYPIIAKGELKIEFKKRGTYVNRFYITAFIDRLVTQ